MDLAFGTKFDARAYGDSALFPASAGRGDGMGRAIDIAMALVLIVLFLPTMLFLALTIYVTDPGRIVFAQRRLGRGGQYFWCLKFRTMCIDADARLQHLLATDPAARAEWDADHKLRDDPRVTKIGRFLRKLSLDELPQLFNILVGDMSFVGPRPIVEAEVGRYGHRFATYCAVRPGLTGLWQVSGRNLTTYRRRVAMDVSYVRAKSVWLDFQILFLTVPRVLLSSGAF